MTRIVVRMLVALALCLISWTITGVSAGDEKGKTFHFLLTVESDVASKLSGNIMGKTEIRYAWQRLGRERTLSLDSLKMKIKNDGKDIMDSIMSHAEIKNKDEKGSVNISYKDAPEHMKRHMDESFGSPVCKLLVDANGKEVKRTVVSNGGARQLADGGMVVNALLFHPPPPGDKDNWLVDAEVTVMGNATAKGKLHYRRKEIANGKQEYQVEGTLTNAEIKGPKNFATRNVRYVMSGTHSYDPALQEWVAAKMTAALSFDIAEGDKVRGTNKGTMHLTFKMLPQSDQ